MPLLLKDNHLLNIGLIFVVVNFRFSNELNDDESLNSIFQENGVNKLKLKLKFFGGPCNGEVFIFEPQEKR